jgi:hypothetical protein
MNLSAQYKPATFSGSRLIRIGAVLLLPGGGRLLFVMFAVQKISLTHESV